MDNGCRILDGITIRFLGSIPTHDNVNVSVNACLSLTGVSSIV